MPLIVRAFPVLPGKEEDIRKLATEMAGKRRKEAEEFYQSLESPTRVGLTQELLTVPW